MKPFSRADAEEKDKATQDMAPAAKAKAIKEKESKGDEDEWKPQNIAEYLFCNQRGEITEDIDPVEVDQIYNGYMQILSQSYEKLKGKFNAFAAKCLSERQKRESGLILVAPPLVMPHEKEEEKASNEEYKSPGDRIGRIGAKMERVMKKDFPEGNPHIQESPDDDIIDEDAEAMDTGPR